MDGKEPGGEDVEEVVEAVGVRDAVDRCVQREEESEDIRDESCSPGDSGSHDAGAHDLDDEDHGEDCEEVVVRAEWRQPVDGDVVYPHDEHGHVYGQDPEHEDEH